MTSRFFIAALTCFLFVVFTSPSRAQVPQMINYQGRVVVGRTNFNGSGQFKFALVDGGSNSVYTTYWSNDGSSSAGSEPASSVVLPVSNGLYSVLLGNANLPNMKAIPPGVFNHSPVRLRVWFNDGVHGSQLLSPDQEIAAVGYAMLAGNVPDGAITANKIATGAIGWSNIAAGAITPALIGAATAEQGEKADAALPATGGTASNLTITSGSIPVTSVTGIQSPQYSLWHVFNKLQRIGANEAVPCTVFVTGDSVAWYEIGPILDELRASFGDGGAALGNVFAVTSAGAVKHSFETDPRFDISPYGTAYTLPTKGVVQFSGNNNGTPTDALADTMAVYFVMDSSTPRTNTFKLQSNLADAGWVDEVVNVTSGSTSIATGVSVVDCAHGSIIGAVATIPRKSWEANYKIRVVQLSGSSTIIGAKMIIARTGGVITAGCSMGGTDMKQGSTVSSKIWAPILQDLHPDLITCKYYDTAAVAAACLAPWQALWDSGAPDADWIYIGTAPYPDSPGGPSDTDLIAQDALYKAHALSHGFCYWSPRTVLPTTWAEIVALGWDGGAPHLSLNCQKFTSAQMSNDLGLRSVVGGIGSFMGNIPTGSTNYSLFGIRKGGQQVGFTVTNSDNTPGSAYFTLANTATNTAGAVTFALSGDASWYIGQSSGQGVGRKTDDTFYIGTLAHKYHFESKDGHVTCISVTTESLSLDKTITAAGTTGAQTINKPTGRVNFAAGATSLVVTNSLCTVDSIIQCTIASNDATASGIKAVAANGSFTLYLSTPPTSETAVNFTLTN